MTFLFAIIYVILLIGLLYLYLLFFKGGWRVITYVRQRYKNRQLIKQGKQPEPINRHDHFKNGWVVLSDKKKNVAVVAIIVGLTLTLFSQNLLRNTTDKNTNHEAKKLFAVGETANTYKMVALNILHPDFPLTWPIEWFQQLLCLHGAYIVPQGDDEIYLWKKLWFYNPYVIPQTPPWGVRARLDTPLYNSKHFSRFYNDYMIVLEKVMDGNISDKKLFYETVPRDISSDTEFSVIFQMYHDGLRYTGEAGIRIAKVAKYQKQTANFYRYSTLAEQWWKDGTIPQSIRAIPEQRLTFLEARYAILEAVMFEKLLNGAVRCEDTSVREYLSHRNTFAEEIPPAYQKRFGMLLNNEDSRFYHYIFTTYCKCEFPASPERVKGWQFHRAPHVDTSESSIRKGMGYDLQDSENNLTLSPLFNALKAKNTAKVLQELDQKHLSPDVRFYGEKTPLHYAAHTNDLKTLQALIARGASINIEDKAGKIPFQYAIQNYSYDTAKYLLEHGSSHKWVADIPIDSDGKYFTTPWAFVINSNYPPEDVARMLILIIEHKIDLFEEKKDCSMNLAKYVIGGAGLINNLNAENKVRAQIKVRTEIVKMLIDAGVDFHVRCEGDSAIEEAIRRADGDDLKIIQMLYPLMTPEEKKQIAQTRYYDTRVIKSLYPLMSPEEKKQYETKN